MKNCPDCKNLMSESASFCMRCGWSEELQRLREALKEISKGEGAYSRDRLTHAENTIRAMKDLARDALGEKENMGRGDEK